jgi:hypothetical protein
MKRFAPPARPRLRHLYAIDGGKQEAEARERLYPVQERRVRAEPKPDPHPPRAA